MCVLNRKEIRKKNGFLIRHFPSEPKCRLVLQEQQVGGGVAEAVTKLCSLELSIPGDTSQSGNLSFPQAAQSLNSQISDWPGGTGTSQNSRGDPWQQQSAAGTEESTCNQEFWSSVSLGMEVPPCSHRIQLPPPYLGSFPTWKFHGFCAKPPTAAVRSQSHVGVHQSSGAVSSLL